MSLPWCHCGRLTSWNDWRVEVDCVWYKLFHILQSRTVFFFFKYILRFLLKWWPFHSADVSCHCSRVSLQTQLIINNLRREIFKGCEISISNLCFKSQWMHRFLLSCNEEVRSWTLQIFEVILMLIFQISKVSKMWLIIIAGVVCFSQHVAWKWCGHRAMHYLHGVNMSASGMAVSQIKSLLILNTGHWIITLCHTWEHWNLANQQQLSVSSSFGWLLPFQNDHRIKLKVQGNCIKLAFFNFLPKQKIVPRKRTLFVCFL